MVNDAIFTLVCGMATHKGYTRLPKQDVQRPTTDFQCLRRMAVGEASLGLGLPGIASVVKQCRLPMVLEGFFQLDSGLPMKGLWRQEGLLENGCIGVGHGVALLGCQQNAIYWEMDGLYATEQTTQTSATTLTLGLQKPRDILFTLLSRLERDLARPLCRAFFCPTFVGIPTALSLSDAVEG